MLPPLPSSAVRHVKGKDVYEDNATTATTTDEEGDNKNDSGSGIPSNSDVRDCHIVCPQCCCLLTMPICQLFDLRPHIHPNCCHWSCHCSRHCNCHHIAFKVSKGTMMREQRQQRQQTTTQGQRWQQFRSSPPPSIIPSFETQRW